MKRVVAALAGGLLLIAGADAASGQARPSVSFSQLTSERQLTDVYRAGWPDLQKNWDARLCRR